VTESSLLRTPVGSEAEGGAIHPDDAAAEKRTLKLGWQILAHFGHLQSKEEKEIANLPTPLSRDYKDGQAERIRDGKPQTDSVYLAVMHSGEVDYESFHESVDLLPTPTTMEHREIKSKERIAEMRAKSPGGYRNLRESVVNEIEATPDEAWGKFGQAILRWETITGRKAPNPTEPDGRDGKHRLSPKFTEWMMGLPDGWITGVDLKRPEMLKCCGNGVVPQQAYLALQILIGNRKEEIFNGGV
jgi:hypothetical protein